MASLGYIRLVLLSLTYLGDVLVTSQGRRFPRAAQVQSLSPNAASEAVWLTFGITSKLKEEKGFACLF